MIKCTTGEVKEMVKNCIQLPPKERYETAKQMMPQSYRDSQRVIAAFCKEIKQWPQIKPGDVKAYRKFENLIVNDSVSSKEAANSTLTRKQKKVGMQCIYQNQKKNLFDLTVRSRCINCGENHELDNCLKFMGMALKDRINFLLMKKFC